jgi:hypothetical protein
MLHLCLDIPSGVFALKVMIQNMNTYLTPPCMFLCDAKSFDKAEGNFLYTVTRTKWQLEIYSQSWWQVHKIFAKCLTS